MTDRSALIRRQVLFWSVAALVSILLLWVFSGILLPFLVGMVIAYFLDPVADWFERRGFSRLMATIVILILFVLFFAAAILVVVPVVGSQIASFVERIPDYLDRLQAIAVSARSGPLAFLFTGEEMNFKQDFAQFASEGTGIVTTFLGGLWSSSLAVVNFVSLFIVAPVVAFYLLLDWDRMVDKIDAWTPRQHVDTVRRLAREIDRSVAGFVRGQGSVCLILGTIYGVGLTLTGLNFGLLIGLFAGLISFIPYVGSAIGLILALGVALVQFWPDWVSILMVAVVFFVGQFFEGNILQPKLVGASVGLHPVWLMFALFAFGALFGFVGLLIAVPAAAAVGVLVRFALSQYLQSEMYYGRTQPQQPAVQIETQSAPPAVGTVPRGEAGE
ncbi:MULTISPECIES: AI-2E family transporter [Aurantimonas]|uniref:AI-2E family transporter n=1 Tax=Aurantimonas TaxID=182269 RepID=UPI000C386FCC|nr:MULTISPECIES: AI-2E family transporter [Aurantimonas]MAP17867.1 AI-2E family transporter [Aurantimonas sp.]MBC6717682.1 AI-2E family transporter [Aurantimonas sp. DM33-3]MCC4299378.1 AI-2E family transporter [Aurantimonas coralicida]MCD1644235.1 AI-2E family transporter [Aurantimonas coralicida]